MVQPHKCSTVYVLELVGRGCVGRPGQYRAAVTNHCMSLSPPPRPPFPLAQPLLHLFIFFRFNGLKFLFLRFSFFPLPEPPFPLVQLHLSSKTSSRIFFLLPALIVPSHIYIFSYYLNHLIQPSSVNSAIWRQRSLVKPNILQKKYIQADSKHMQSAGTQVISDAKQISKHICGAFQEQFGKINCLKDFSHQSKVKRVKTGNRESKGTRYSVENQVENRVKDAA